MINTSYFSDLQIVSKMLSLEELKESNSITLELFNSLGRRYEKFKQMIESDSTDNVDLESEYKNITKDYLSLEQQLAPYNINYKTIFNYRNRVKNCFYKVTNKNSNLIKSKIILANKLLSESNLVILNRLVRESSCISFELNEEEFEILCDIEESIRDL